MRCIALAECFFFFISLVSYKSRFSLNTLLYLNIYFQYLGDWYEVYKFYAAFESGQSCARANYTLKDDGHIKVLNRGYK